MIIIHAIENERQKRLALRHTQKFKSTNKIWNDLGLNQAWSIGYLTTLFKLYGGKDYSQWEQFYYKSGQNRLKKIALLRKDKQNILKDFRLYAKNDIYSLNMISKTDKYLNTHFGRTERELNAIGSFMHEEILKKGNPLKITESECIEFVKIRVLDEILMGIDRELNTINRLQKKFPGATFKEVPIEIDSKYAVDYEVFLGDKLLLALQIKSANYKKDNQSILIETKNFNQNKNRDYEQKFGVEVLYVYANEKGQIAEGSQVYSKINDCLYGELQKAR